MESIPSLCNCDNVSAYVESCCFNPTIYFVCKLCRGAFKNVEKLLLHKRQKHTLNELKGIKFIAFEERFVETDADTFPRPSLSTSVEFKCEVDGTTCDKYSDQHLHLVENHEIKTIVDIPSKSAKIKLPNPYVYLRRLSALEIRSYSRLSRCSAPPLEIQHPDDCNEINQDNRCDFNEQNALYNNTVVANNSDSETENISNGSNSTSNRNVSAQSADLPDSHISRIVQDEEIVRFPEPFIHLENVIIEQLKSRCRSAKSSESSPSCSSFTNNVQPPSSRFNLTAQEENHILSAKRCKLSDAETICSNSRPQLISSAVIYDVNSAEELESEIKEQELADGEFIVANILQSSDGVGKVQFLSTSNPVTTVTDPVDSTVVSELKENVESVKKESDSESVNSDDAPPSPAPSPVPPSPKNANPDTHYDNEDQVSIETDAPAIRFSASPEFLSQSSVSPPSSTSNIASTRTLRNRSKLNYSENQTCAKCSRDFYTVEELEAHEKVCVRIRNKTNRKIFPNRGSPALTPISGRTVATPHDINDEILVIQTAAVSPNDLDVEVEIIESEGDDNDYESPDVISGDSDAQERVVVSQRVRNKDIPIPAIYAHCRLSIKEWIKKERATNPENIICLDPDPFQGETDDVTDTEATVFVVTAETSLKCKLCLKTLTSDPMAKTHLNYCWHNNKKKHFYCPICPKYFKGKRGLYYHNRLKHPKPGDVPLPSHNNRRMKCTVCSKEFNNTKTSFKKHMETHEKPNEKNFFCEICGSGFRTKHGLQRHDLTHSEDRPFKCKLCPMTFKKNYFLSLHMAVHVKDKNYHCSTCSKSFVSKKRLNGHAKLHSKDQWFSCNVDNCDFRCPNKVTLVYHCKVNHKEAYLQIAKFPCTDCNEKFAYKHQLEKHVMVHSGQKPFKCSAEGCNRAFRIKHQLNEHLRTHTGERPFQCDKCGTAFWKKYSFDKHMRGHNNPPDQVLCHLCPRKFPHNYELQQHLIFHEKGKQFKCDTCGFRCMTKAGLKGHMKTHEQKVDAETDSSSDCESKDDEDTAEESASESESPDSEKDST